MSLKLFASGSVKGSTLKIRMVCQQFQSANLNLMAEMLQPFAVCTNSLFDKFQHCDFDINNPFGTTRIIKKKKDKNVKKFG